MPNSELMDYYSLYTFVLFETECLKYGKEKNFFFSFLTVLTIFK